MLDKAKFMETLRSIAELAKVSDSPLSKEQIQEYFDDMILTNEQLTMVFQYLQQPQQDTIEEDQKDQEAEKEAIEEGNELSYEGEGYANESKKREEKESVFLQMYLEDIGSLPLHTNSEVQTLYMKLVQGDASVTQEIIDFWLLKVVELAKNYTSYPVIMEDMIQEGNIGLLSGLNQLLGIKKTIDVEEFLKESVQQAIENYIDDMSNDDDWENTILAKTTLINEARKALAEENAELPSIQQLAEYTKISEQEIEDILRLSKDNN